MPVSNIPSEMIEAYRATDYRVFDQSPFVLNIGRSCQPLKQLYNKHGCASAAFITAWNPYSQAVSNDRSKTAEASNYATRLPSRSWSPSTELSAAGCPRRA